MAIRGRYPWHSQDSDIAISAFKPTPQDEINQCLECSKHECDNCLCNDTCNKIDLLEELLAHHVKRSDILGILGISKTTYLKYKHQIFT